MFMQRLTMLFQTTKDKVKETWNYKTLPPEVLECRKKIVNRLIDGRSAVFVDLFNEEVISDPVISDTGDVYDRSSLNQWLEHHHTLPLTNLPYRENELVEAPTVKLILNDYKRDLDGILKEISSLQKLTDEKFINVRVDLHLGRMKFYEEKFITAKAEAIQKNIETIKDRLYIDNKNPIHLAYWEEKGSCNLSFVTIHSGGRFKVSPQVYDIFQVASHEYKRVSDFLTALKQAQQNKPGCWIRFWGVTEKAKQITHKDFVNSDIASVQPDWRQTLVSICSGKF